jgi:hypothetical protein
VHITVPNLADLSLSGKYHVITSIPFGELDNASNIVDYLDVTDAKERYLECCCHLMTVA